MQDERLQIIISRMEAEQKHYKDHLQTLNSEEILDHAREYIQREDIIANTKKLDCMRDDVLDSVVKYEMPLEEAIKYYKLEASEDDYIGDVFLMMAGGDPDKESCCDRKKIFEKHGWQYPMK